MVFKMKRLIFVIIASIFFCEMIQGHPIGPQKSSVDESDLYGNEVYDVKNIKTLNDEEALDIIRKYYSESEITTFKTLPGAVSRECKEFNEMTNKPMTFREYHALKLFKGNGFFYLNPQGQNAEKFRYTAYEVTRALITIGERMRHYEVDMRRHFNGISSNTVYNTKNSVLWRGEIRDKTDIDNMVYSRLYTTGDRFVSFTKFQERGEYFTIMARKKADQVRVLYKYTNLGPIYHLDIARATSSHDYEDEVVLYPMMEFRVFDIQDLVLEKDFPYKLIHIENGRSFDYDEWKRNNKKILKASYERAHNVSNLHSLAVELKDSSKSTPTKVLQNVDPCISKH